MQTSSLRNIKKTQKFLSCKNFFLVAVSCVPVFSFAQSTKNYVKTWQATAPETDANTLMGRGLSDVKQTAAYFDGLGRQEQNVIKKGSLSTSGNTDLVVPVVYDAFGREAQKYLPYAATSNDGLYKTSPVSDQNTFYTGSKSPVNGQGESYFYSKNVLESSPLNRVMESFAPGVNWAGTAGQSSESARRGIKTRYWINRAADSVVIWNVTDVSNNFGTYAANGYYTLGRLYKNVTVDEDNHQVIEFKDKEGKIILKKVQLTATADDSTGRGHYGWLCTYYIYDNAGQLRAVIQPEGVKTLAANSWDLTYSNGVLLIEQCFRYEYDSRGRMIMKKVPGAGAVWMVYDRWDRLVLTQDGNQRPLHNWTYIKYDIMNRPIITGLHHDPYSITLAEINAHLEEAAAWQIRYESESATTIGYTLTQTYPYQVESSVLTATHYDNYTWTNNIPLAVRNFDNSFSFPNGSTVYPYPQSVAVSYSTQGMVTGSLTRVLGAGLLASVNFYDEKGRLIQNKSENITSGCDITTTQYSFSGQPLQTVQKQEKPGTNAQTTVVVTQNTYDDLGRITKVEKKLSNTNVNGNAMSSYKTILQNEYDAIGQLKKKKIGTAPNTTNELTKMEYDYNIRGWVLGMNRNYLKNNNASGYEENYFGFELGYDKSATTPGTTGFGYLNYNGNIAGTIWKSAGDQVRRYYDFLYDNANRLGRANYYQFVSPGSSGTWDLFDASFSVHGNNTSYNNAVAGNNNYITYDANGNITGMVHHGWKLGTPNTILDAMTYNYFDNSNQLKNVVDAAQDKNTKLGDFRYSTLYENTVTATKPSTAIDYAYDSNGNLVKDLNKDIETYSGANGIEYNHLNLATKIIIKAGGSGNKGSIDYVYDAGGNKLKKIVHETGQADKTTLYIGGFVYENDVLQFLPHEEGRIRYNTTGSFAWDYFLKDHLGNVRAVLTEEQKTDMYDPASLETTPLANERLYYSKVDSGRVNKSTVSGYPSDIYTAPNDYIQKLNGNGVKVGTGIVLKVMAGDKINLRASSWWKSNGVSPGSTANPLSDLINVLSVGIAPFSNKASTSELSGSSVFSGEAQTFLNTQSSYTTSKPKAFVSWVLFDEQFKYDSTSSGTEQVGADNTFTVHTQSNLPVNKNGYLYVYVSNETTNLDVFFDNLQVTHIHGPILDETHYYPFGLTMAGISSKAAGTTENKKKYQQYELNSDFDINLYESFYRSHDPQLGRFWQIDPKPNFSESPYASMGNNPIMNMDPLGDTLLNKADNRIANRIEKRLNSTNASLNKQASKLNSQIAAAEAKGDKAKTDALRAKSGDVNSRVSTNATSLSRLNAIRNDQTKGYTFNQLPSGSKGETKLGFGINSAGDKVPAVVMNIVGDGNAIHEMNHAYQGAIQHSIMLTWTNIFFPGKTLLDQQMTNANAEIEAYKAQYSFDPGSIPPSIMTGTPQSISGINAPYVAGINDSSNQPAYPDVRNMVVTAIAKAILGIP